MRGEQKTVMPLQLEGQQAEETQRIRVFDTDLKVPENVPGATHQPRTFSSETQRLRVISGKSQWNIRVSLGS